MPRPPCIHPDALLFTYQEAAWILGCALEEFTLLIDRGLITPSAPGMVPRESVIDLTFAGAVE